VPPCPIAVALADPTGGRPPTMTSTVRTCHRPEPFALVRGVRVSHPFDDDSQDFLALRNEEEQYSLWPQDITVPDGWRVVYGPAPRQEVVDHIDRSWTDMRPKSLREGMPSHGGAQSAGADGVPPAPAGVPS
jgi:MbtH protein